MHFHAYASPDYLKRFGTPRGHEELDKHRIILLSGTVPAHFANRRWLLEVARDGKGPRAPALTVNNVLGILRACQRGLGIAMLPDYLVEENGGLVARIKRRQLGPIWMRRRGKARIAWF